MPPQQRLQEDNGIRRCRRCRLRLSTGDKVFTRRRSAHLIPNRLACPCRHPSMLLHCTILCSQLAPAAILQHRRRPAVRHRICTSASRPPLHISTCRTTQIEARQRPPRSSFLPHGPLLLEAAVASAAVTPSQQRPRPSRPRSGPEEARSQARASPPPGARPGCPRQFPPPLPARCAIAPPRSDASRDPAPPPAPLLRPEAS